METGYKLGALEANVKTLQADMSEVKVDQKEQNRKLDLLVADMNKRKGAKALLVTIASTGFLGWLWEYFHK